MCMRMRAFDRNTRAHFMYSRKHTSSYILCDSLLLLFSIFCELTMCMYVWWLLVHQQSSTLVSVGRDKMCCVLFGRVRHSMAFAFLFALLYSRASMYAIVYTGESLQRRVCSEKSVQSTKFKNDFSNYELNHSWNALWPSLAFKEKLHRHWAASALFATVFFVFIFKFISFIFFVSNKNVESILMALSVWSSLEVVCLLSKYVRKNRRKIVASSSKYDSILKLCQRRFICQLACVTFMESSTYKDWFWSEISSFLEHYIRVQTGDVISDTVLWFISYYAMFFDWKTL